MSHRLDLLDLRILDGLARYGVRNISNVARKLAVPEATLRKRLKRLISHFYLRFVANIYHTNLGLRKAVVLVDAMPGYENVSFECLKANDFWIYAVRCYGKREGCQAVYTIPKESPTQFEKFLEELRALNFVRNVKVLWTTCFQTVQSRCSWFDPKLRKWVFRWDEWIKEIPEESVALPYTLVDPKDFPVMADEIDLFILKELEKDALKDLTEIGKMLGISQQLVGYHYNKHIILRNLIESFDIVFRQFDLSVSDMFLFIFMFDSGRKLAKFANSLIDKPFVRGIGKVLGKNALIVRIYLPKLEFRRFIDVLSELVRKGVVQSYDYVIQDLRKASRETIPYQCFKDGRWIYDHDKHVQRLRSYIQEVMKDRPKTEPLLEA
jgi:DNA-binding Lrp family transcriptional regulator